MVTKSAEAARADQAAQAARTVRAVQRPDDAEDVVARLRGALGVLGVVLPSLRVDPLTAASDDPCRLVELGRCNLETAARLIAVLSEVQP